MRAQSAFHDMGYVYLQLDYYPGGDLLSLLGKHDCFKEDMARFYMSEMVVAVSTVHRMGYLHRDIKVK
jgi:serine/threonine protein kinase